MNLVISMSSHVNWYFLTVNIIVVIIRKGKEIKRNKGGKFIFIVYLRSTIST